MTLKEELYIYCEQFLEERFSAVVDRIEGIQESLKSETKSSAGDKHETGRAMLQLEREKAGNQLLDINKQKELFAKISTDAASQVACLGSLVTTDKGYYYLAISAGLITIKNNKYYAISTNSPIGSILLGKVKGAVFSFNGINQEIIAIS
jgi:transcription elongation GreA/GreB family factor